MRTMIHALAVVAVSLSAGVHSVQAQTIVLPMPYSQVPYAPPPFPQPLSQRPLHAPPFAPPFLPPFLPPFSPPFAPPFSPPRHPSAAQPEPDYDQSGPALPPVAKTVSLAGPRFGLTILSDETIAKLQEHDIVVKSTISQFGWQFEREFYSKQDGPTVLNEWVFLLGGLDQGVVIPSLNWLVGLRTKEGTEFGIGPNITPAGVALALAAGVTVRAGVINVPMNFAVVPSKYGTRISVLTGFVLRH